MLEGKRFRGIQKNLHRNIRGANRVTAPEEKVRVWDTEASVPGSPEILIVHISREMMDVEWDVICGTGAPDRTPFRVHHAHSGGCAIVTSLPGWLDGELMEGRGIHPGHRRHEPERRGVGGRSWPLPRVLDLPSLIRHLYCEDPLSQRRHRPDLIDRCRHGAECQCFSKVNCLHVQRAPGNGNRLALGSSGYWVAGGYK